MIPAMVLLSALPFMPRSPRWLASKDRWDEVVRIIALLRANGNEADTGVIAEVDEIRKRVQ